MLILLWTDIFIWVLILTVGISIYYLSGRQDFKFAMSNLMSSTTAQLTGIVLLIYLLIGLADSIHIREYLSVNQNNTVVYGDVESLLDHFLEPRSNQHEKTFSAPFDSTLYSKERIVDSSGTIITIYPGLKHISKVSNVKLLFSLLKKLLLAVISVIIICYLTNYLVNRYCNKTFTKNNRRTLPTKNKSILYTLLDNRLLCFVMLGIILLFVSLSHFNSYYHVLGTDKIGQDILHVTIKSIRTGIIIGSLTTIFMLPLAISLGTISGYYGGKVDDVIQYIYTTLSSIPGVLLISACILIIQTQMSLHPDWFESLAEQADIRLLSLCIILGITSWSGLCRLLRAETLKLKEMDYVTAAKTMKVSNIKIIIRHIIPNLSHIIIINIAINFSGLVLAEAVLSYIGVGVDPTTMSWGNMINSARLELSREPIVWWPIVGAFIPMFIFVLSLNLFADKLRDAFDPKAT